MQKIKSLIKNIFFLIGDDAEEADFSPMEETVTSLMLITLCRSFYALHSLILS